VEIKEDLSSKLETGLWDNINIYCEEVGYEAVDFSHVAHT
jgi:hypothetical protein